jgi:hypothetical protein
MRKIFLISIFILTSCSSSWHLAKAVKKGYAPKKETTTVERITIETIYDTTTNTILKVDTITETIYNTIYQDRPLTRIEYKTIKDTIRIAANSEVKQNRDNIKADRKMNRNKLTSLSWLNWLLLGAVAILYLVKRSNQ